MTQDDSKVLVTICARGGSKGVPSKNIRPLLGIPLIAHSIRHALGWNRTTRVVVSTDSEEISHVAREYGAEAPFLRPAALATDTASKLPVLTHALEESERHYNERYDAVLDLDVTAPVRTLKDIERGWEVFKRSGKPICFSVVKARKNPYFNMVEKDERGAVRLVAQPKTPFPSRQLAPTVWEINASIYFYTRAFLLSRPTTLWDGDPEFFEMGTECAFDIDEERDFVISELMMRLHGRL